jgi:hypothetical protein
VKHLDLTIETDSDGRHVVVFPELHDELAAPSQYEDRLSWIQDSFSKFLVTVRDLDTLRSGPYIKSIAQQ